MVPRDSLLRQTAVEWDDPFPVDTSYWLSRETVVPVGEVARITPAAYEVVTQVLAATSSPCCPG
jgi:hypothetical protein